MDSLEFDKIVPPSVGKKKKKKMPAFDKVAIDRPAIAAATGKGQSALAKKDGSVVRRTVVIPASLDDATRQVMGEWGVKAGDFYTFVFAHFMETYEGGGFAGAVKKVVVEVPAMPQKWQ